MLLLLLSPAKTINAGAKVVAGAPKPTVPCFQVATQPRAHGFRPSALAWHVFQGLGVGPVATPICQSVGRSKLLCVTENG